MPSFNFTLNSAHPAGPDTIGRLLIRSEPLRTVWGVGVCVIDQSYVQIRVGRVVLGGITVTETKEWNGTHTTRGVITDLTGDRHLLTAAATVLASDVSNTALHFRQA